jgi:protein involved in polysaccharide export with SLBB domain
MKMRVLPAVCFGLTLVVGVADLRAQERDYSQPEGASAQTQTRAINEADSRAEQEAERLVSLAPEKIILLLEQEPGLFLEVKRMLVRKAYAQGRLLDPKELTDEAVFRMVRDDEETRTLITQQIVDRGYVRAKPTRQEIVRDYEQQQKMARANARQEQADNEEFPGAEGESSQQNPNGTQPAGRSPQYPPAYPQNVPFQETPQPSSPQTPITDQRRALMQASLGSSSSQDDSGGLPLNVVNGGQQQISPEQIQQLISAYGKSGMQSTGGQPDLAKLAASMGTSNASPRVSQLPQSQEEAYAGQQQPTVLPQQARLQTNSMYPRQQQRRPAHTTEDQPALLHRANPYADVPSLYDLYSQYSRRPSELKRFGLDIFETGTGNLDQLPMDLPAGPDYVLGPGDGVSIDFWGSVSQRLHRVIDRAGRLSLPEVGTIQVSGHSLGDVQRIVQSALRSQYRELDANVSLDGLRTVRVYVVGDVQRPGAYDVSSLSTPLNALYEAGGPTSKGSMRVVKHYRGNQLVENVDLYQLLLRGVQAGTQRLESGDTILVPPLGQEITVEGMIRRPAIYELGGEKNLAEVLELAGGVLPSGTLRHVDVERVEAHQNRSMLRLDIPESDSPESQTQATVTEALEKFQVQDGDRIKISPILPFADKTVFLDGHVFRPGKYAYRDGMKITDLVHNYRDLLPEPYKQHAEIIRLRAPDYKPQIIAFNLDDALAGKDPDLTLKPFDTIRVFSRFDFEDPPIITISGEVRDPGDHVTNGATYLRDAIFLAGNTAQDAELEDVQVFRKTHDGKMQVISANLRKAIAGDPNENILLEPQDRVFVHKDVLRLDLPTVEVQGEVARPGKYPLGTDMTATGLVRVAGGLKRSAYTQEAELTRYTINHGEQFEGEHLPIAIGQALTGEPDTDMRLRAGDVLTIRQIAGWKDIGATVKVDGEVVHPGTYGVQEGERLSDVIARAGGFRADAYPYGSIFERLQVREIEEKNRVQLIAEAQQEGGGLGAGATTSIQDASLVQWRDTLHQLQTTPPVGRLVIHISSGKSWLHTPADIQVRADDSIYIPKKPNFVMVQGAVYNQTGIAFRPGKSARWYLHQAGGPTSAADKKNVFVVRADGTVAGGPKGLFNGGALESAMQPGDMIVIPSKALGGGFKWRQTLEVAQLVSAIGIAVQVARGF